MNTPREMSPEPEELPESEVRSVDPTALDIAIGLLRRFDRFEERIERRFDAFHGELAILRSHILVSQEGRLVKTSEKADDASKRADAATQKADAVERSTMAKVGSGAAKGVSWGVYVAFAVMVLNGLARRYPWLQEFADALKGVSP